MAIPSSWTAVPAPRGGRHRAEALRWVHEHPHLIDPRRRLHLDHVRPQVREQLRDQRPGRHPAIPDIQTFEEAGLKDIAVLLWYGIVAPAGTPKDNVAPLIQEIARSLQPPAVRERFAALALDISPSGPVGVRLGGRRNADRALPAPGHHVARIIEGQSAAVMCRTPGSG